LSVLIFIVTRINLVCLKLCCSVATKAASQLCAEGIHA